MRSSVFFWAYTITSLSDVNAFVVRTIRSAQSTLSSPASCASHSFGRTNACVLHSAVDESGGESSGSTGTITRVPEKDEDTPIPFLDASGTSFIECYADSVAKVNGVEYTIGVPCDYTVALCYYEGDNLVPIDLNDELMDDVFSIAEHIVADEFDEELALQRTPQTLTLVGELEEDDDDGEDGDEEEFDDSPEDEEEVEMLLSFEHRDREFHLVRLLDPILLVGKQDEKRKEFRVLLTPEESDQVMPVLEELFLQQLGQPL